jgi:allophanate hydrolase subunit 2
MEVSCPPGAIRARFVRIPAEAAPFFCHPFRDSGVPLTLRALDGPQAGWFAAADFFHPPGAEPPKPVFTVTPASNRMGLRLHGPPLRLPERELVSEPVCPGTVQVTRDGQCIILGVDGQTIGGYPKVAQVISADLDRLGQLRPGDRVCFQRMELVEAEVAYHEKQAALRAWLVRLRTAEVFA